jgi:hypothetical protein
MNIYFFRLTNQDARWPGAGSFDLSPRYPRLLCDHCCKSGSHQLKKSDGKSLRFAFRNIRRILPENPSLRLRCIPLSTSVKLELCNLVAVLVTVWESVEEILQISPADDMLGNVVECNLAESPADFQAPRSTCLTIAGWPFSFVQGKRVSDRRYSIELAWNDNRQILPLLRNGHSGMELFTPSGF